MNTQHMPLRTLLHTLDTHIQREQHAQALVLLMTNIPRLKGNFLFKYYAANLLLKLGYDSMAHEMFEYCATHFTNSGQPLLALAATKKLPTSNSNREHLLNHIASLYNNGSPFLEATPIPSLLHSSSKDSFELKVPPSIDAPVEDLARNLHKMVTRKEHFAASVHDHLPQIPLLSNLNSHELRALFDQLQLRSFEPGNPILHPDEPALPTWIACGESSLHTPDQPAHALPSNISFNFSTILGRPNVSPRMTILATSTCDCLLFPTDTLASLRTNPALLRAAAATHTASQVDHTLATLSILGSLLQNERHHTLQYMEALRIPRDTTLAEQAQPNPGLFIIISGKVALTHDSGGDMGHAGPGDILGEIGLITDGRSALTATTEEDTQALFISTERYKKFSQSYPSIHESLCEDAAKKLLAS